MASDFLVIVLPVFGKEMRGPPTQHHGETLFGHARERSEEDVDTSKASLFYMFFMFFGTSIVHILLKIAVLVRTSDTNDGEN